MDTAQLLVAALMRPNTGVFWASAAARLETGA